MKLKNPKLIAVDVPSTKELFEHLFVIRNSTIIIIIGSLSEGPNLLVPYEKIVTPNLELVHMKFSCLLL